MTRGKIEMDTPAAAPAPDAGARGAIEMDAEQPGVVESGLRGAAQGASLGFADEITGAGEAMLDRLMGSHEKLVDLYRLHRDESRAKYAAAEQANPEVSMAGNLVGGLATVAIPGLGAGGIGAQALKMAGLGLASGVGNSEADTARGLIEDGAIGGAVGGVAGGIAGAAGQLVGKGARVVGEQAERQAGRMAEAAAAKQAGQAQAAAQSARGAHGQVVGSAMTLGRNLEANVAGRAGVLSPEAQAASKGALSEISPILEEQAAKHAAEAPQVAAKVAESRAAMEAAQAAAQAPAAPAAAPALSEALAPHVKALGRQLALPAAGAAIGAVTGEDPLHGGLAGAAAGALGGTSLARPLMAAGRRALRSEPVKHATLDMIASLAKTNPQALGKWGGYLAAAAARGPQALSTTHYALSQTDGEYAARVRTAMADNEK